MAISLQFIPVWTPCTAKDNPMHVLMPLILQRHKEGRECTLRFSHPYNSTRITRSAKQGSGALDWLQSFWFVMFGGAVPEQHQGHQPREGQFTSCATADVLDIKNPLWNTDKAKARAVNSYLNTHWHWERLTMIFRRKGILLVIQHPLPSIGAEPLQSILQELQGPPAKDLPLHHFTPTGLLSFNIYTSAI